jgi:zinc transporter ZupT
MEIIKNLWGGKLDLRTKKSKRTFLIINILLLSGIVLIVSTLLYLLFNLNQSDRLIYKSIFMIITGLVLVLSYAIGFNEIKKKQNTHNHF